jgi:hypothetical protein
MKKPKLLTWETITKLAETPPHDGRLHFWWRIQDEIKKAIEAERTHGDVPLGLFWKQLTELEQNTIIEAFEKK